MALIRVNVWLIGLLVLLELKLLGLQQHVLVLQELLLLNVLLIQQLELLLDRVLIIR